MVSFTNAQDYYLYPHPMDMRKDIDSLSDIVRQEMCQDPTRLNGVFLFLSKNRRMMKVLYRGLQRFELTKIRLDKGKFLRPVNNEGLNSLHITWSDYVNITEIISVNELVVRDIDIQR